LVEPLAQGGMGDVWVADHLALGTRVAVRFLNEARYTDEGARARFEREAGASAKVSSPHVIRTFDAGLCENRPYIVMEVLEGETLVDRIHRDGPLQPEDVLLIIEQVGAALDAAHACGVIHRDVKPANVFLVRGPRLFCKLLDFGVAKERRVARISVPTTGLRLAKSQIKVGLLLEAHATLERVVQFAQQADEPSSFTEARDEARALRPEVLARIPVIAVQVRGAPPSTVTILIDGNVVPSDADAARTQVNPGDRSPASEDLTYREARTRVLDRFEHQYLTRLLERAEGNVSKAARIAKMDRSHLTDLLRRHNLRQGDSLCPASRGECAKKVAWSTSTFSMRCAHHEVAARQGRERSRASTLKSCSPNCSTISLSATSSPRPTSTTWWLGASLRQGSKARASRATRCSPPAGRMK
jgi:serine/threonine protein kinase